MFFWFDLEGVAQDARARMRCGPESHDLGSKCDEPVVFVMRLMVERDVNGHGSVARAELLLLLFLLLHHVNFVGIIKRLENIRTEQFATDIVQLRLCFV